MKYFNFYLPLLNQREGHWNLSNGDCDVLEGKGHSNQVQDMVECDGQIISCGFDDVIIFSSTETNTYG